MTRKNEIDVDHSPRRRSDRRRQAKDQHGHHLSALAEVALSHVDAEAESHYALVDGNGREQLHNGREFFHQPERQTLEHRMDG